MKIIFTFLTFFSTFIGYSQQYVYDANDIAIATYEFELAHFDSITKYTPDTLITAVARFSPGGALQDVSYYKGQLQYDGFDDTLGAEVTVWPGFDAFIKSQYEFLPGSHYDEERGRADVMTFVLHLNKDSLPKAIVLQKKQKETEKQFLEELMAQNPFVDVAPNTAFTVNVKKLEINRRNQQALGQVKGKLMYLDSGTVRLSPECYMIFKVLKTSENGSPVNYFEYKLFVIKDGQATLYVKENRLEVDNGIVNLKVSGNREYEEEVDEEDDEDDEVIVVNGRQYYDFGAEEEPGTIVSTDSFDVEIDITFGKP